jgi:hypothetical protein
MATLECNEFENLQRRKGTDYSLGHRLMYETPIKLLTGAKRSIVEAGFGIGWGLDQMVKADIIHRYVGYEPHPEAFEYVRQRHDHVPSVSLVKGNFQATPGANHVFCIEVIEHVPADQHRNFIAMLRASGKTLWLSTPDKNRVASEGVRTTAEWKELLKVGGYSDVITHDEQWTTLLIAQ